MKVIITGGSGKAGREAVRIIADAGHDVTNLDRVRPTVDLPGKFIQLDMTDAGEVYDALAQVRPDGVCHLGANPSPSGFPRQQTFQNNVMSTYHMMQAAGDLGVQRFVYASSEMATGWLTTDELPPHFPFSEEDRVDSPNAYALSKYMGEVIANSMTRRYPDMALVSLRINNVVAPDNYAKLQHRRDNFPAGGGNFWSYIDARDVAGAFFGRARRRERGPRSLPDCGGRYLLGDADPGGRRAPLRRGGRVALRRGPRAAPIGLRLWQNRAHVWLDAAV